METSQTFTPLDVYMVLTLASVLVNIFYGAVVHSKLLAVDQPVQVEERLVCINNGSLWNHGCELDCSLVTKSETAGKGFAGLGWRVGAVVSVLGAPGPFASSLVSFRSSRLSVSPDCCVFCVCIFITMRKHR